MTRGSRFDFLDEVAAEEPQEVQEPETGNPVTVPSAAPQAGPYLFQQHPRNEPLAPLGNRVRLPAKHSLEDYVRELKRAGYPATEARVLEALMLMIDEDSEMKSRLHVYLTGKPD